MDSRHEMSDSTFGAHNQITDSFISWSSDTSKLLTFNTQIMATASKLYLDGGQLPIKVCQAGDISWFCVCVCVCFFFIKHA